MIHQTLHLTNDSEIQDILWAIRDEVGYAENKFPMWPTDIIHSVAIMAEESGEAVKATLDYACDRGSADQVREELIQTAAMCVRAISALDAGVVQRPAACGGPALSTEHKP